MGLLPNSSYLYGHTLGLTLTGFSFEPGFTLEVKRMNCNQSFHIILEQTKDEPAIKEEPPPVYNTLEPPSDEEDDYDDTAEPAIEEEPPPVYNTLEPPSDDEDDYDDTAESRCRTV